MERVRTARTKPQLETGPQKWVVLGPTGLFRNALNAVAMGSAQTTCSIISDHIEFESAQHRIDFDSRRKHCWKHGERGKRARVRCFDVRGCWVWTCGDGEELTHEHQKRGALRWGAILKKEMVWWSGHVKLRTRPHGVHSHTTTFYYHCSKNKRTNLVRSKATEFDQIYSLCAQI